MFKRLMLRIGVGLLVALPLSATGAAFAMGGQPAPAPQEDGPACFVCHDRLHDVWEDGAHGQAAVDPIFREAWQAEGSPTRCLTCHASRYDAATGEASEMGVTCVACHGEYIDGHPAEPMPTYRSATTCAQCHGETHLEFQASSHSNFEGGCISCHDPHAASVRAEQASNLCGSCHQTMAEGFSHNIHNTAGLTCADCHLEEPVLSDGEVHGARNHSFTVSLSSCTQCHDFHSYEDWDMATDVELPAELTTAQAGLQAEPEPVSPVGYAALVGIFGMAGGMILSPWLENFYRRLKHEE